MDIAGNIQGFKNGQMRFPIIGIDRWDDGVTQLLVKDDVLKRLAEIPWNAAINTRIYLNPDDIRRLSLPLSEEIDVWPDMQLPVFGSVGLGALVEEIRRAAQRIRAENRKPFQSVERKIQAVKEQAELFRNTIISTGEKTPKGSIVEAVTIPWFELIDAVSKDPRLLEQFSKSPQKLEELVAGAYRRLGFESVVLTKRSGDGGIDVIAERRDAGLGTVRIIDQVKAYRPGRLVTGEEVRALYGVLMSQPGTAKAFMTTTSEFAPRIHDEDLIKTASPGRIELINGEQLLKRLQAAAQGRLWR